jgi:RES domain-containing protein
VWAEWAAATRGAIDPSSERRRLWRIDVDGLRVVDLRRAAVRDELGVELSELIGPRRAAQSLSTTAHSLGADGMIVPSAAHPERWNLVVFPAGFASLRVAGSTASRPNPPG